jgi:hypothetical protein
MEDIVRDYLWYEYEGKIIKEIFNKCIRWKNNNKNFRQALIDKLFRPEDIRRFYLLGHSIYNISSIFFEEFVNKETLYYRYKMIQLDNLESPVDAQLLEYNIWNYKGNVEKFEKFIEIYEKKI